jgi:hypothetical protein
MDNFGFGGFHIVFGLVAGFIVLVFVVLVGFFIATAVRAARQGRKDNAAPEVSAIARVVDKRIQVSGGDDFPVREEHFVTFEQTAGERFELQVPASEYGLLVVGDQGSVTMKGTRFLSFQRELLR